MDATDRAIIDGLQGGFPLTARPFAQAAMDLGLSEAALLTRLGALLAAGTLTRFGPLWDVERLGGAYCLAAMAVPGAQVAQVADFVNALPEVAHNYERTHRLNMWFVLATETPAGIDAAAAEITAATGLDVYRFPKLREFFIQARFSSDPAAPLPAVPIPANPPANPAAAPIDPAAARLLLRATQAGLPLVPEPYALLADQLGLPESELRARLAAALAAGAIRRIGAVPNHYALGWRANGMSVWDVADAALADLGPQVGALPFVTHCYERPRAPPDWPYNLFAMVHGADQADCDGKIAGIADLLGPACRARAVLWSTRILKKTGVRLRAPEESSCSV